MTHVRTLHFRIVPWENPNALAAFLMILVSRAIARSCNRFSSIEVAAAMEDATLQ
jgi:hypothetical protein